MLCRSETIEAASIVTIWDTPTTTYIPKNEADFNFPRESWFRIVLGQEDVARIILAEEEGLNPKPPRAFQEDKWNNSV